MKKITSILLVAFFFSCAPQEMHELNKNPKGAGVVPGTFLISNATVELVNFLSTKDRNLNSFNYWAQHVATLTYDTDVYNVTEGNLNGNTFNKFYVEILRDLKEARIIIEEDEKLLEELKRNQLAIVDVLEVVSYTILADIFGDIPFSEALDESKFTPIYDDDAAIYAAMIEQLDRAIEQIGGSSGFYDEPIYGDDMVAWKKFANSYKLKLAIRIADVDGDKAKKMAEEAVNSGVFVSDSDNFLLQYNSDYPNPANEFALHGGEWAIYTSSNTMVDYMNESNDPRRPLYFQQNLIVDSLGGLIYRGGVFGQINSRVHTTEINYKILAQDFPGTLMSYTEVLFLLADAAERGYDVGGSGEEFYRAAVTNSILEWGGTEAQAIEYLFYPAVNYSNTTTTWREKIGLQKWLAMYTRGFEAWSTYRMYDAPKMNLSGWPEEPPSLRYKYPSSEYIYNSENVENAAGRIGSDAPFSRVFWDKN